MANVNDVAALILEQGGEMTAMKLQKLVYYSQAWSLVWDERPLFPEVIEAWANGPVCPELYRVHQGRFLLRSGEIGGDPARVDDAGRETIRIVLEFYGNKTAQWLSDLTHLEAPWVNARARAGASPGNTCNEIITISEIAEYYGSLAPDDVSEETLS